MIDIKDKHDCCGCTACESICPHSAITMKPDVLGFKYPEVDKAKCTDCGLCEKVCQTSSPLKSQVNELKAFAVINNNEEIRLASSSGGVFTAIASKIVQMGGKVFGAKFSKDFKNVIISWTDCLDGLKEFRGSKYVQSTINDSFKECKLFLHKGEKVLFSGTPCQIQGLKKYLRKDYDNLWTVDFICHGVPAPLLWQKYVNFHEKRAASNVVKTSFRYKKSGWKQYSLLLAFANNSEYCITMDKDPYIQIFLKDICLRPSCYKCPSKGLERVSDVTLADFWGIQQEYPELDDNKGISFVIVHNPKIIDLFSDCCTIKEIDLKSGLKHNPSMIKSCAKPKTRDTFSRDLNTLSFDKIIKKYAVTPWYVRGYRYVKRFKEKIKKMVNIKK